MWPRSWVFIGIFFTHAHAVSGVHHIRPTSCRCLELGQTPLIWETKPFEILIMFQGSLVLQPGLTDSCYYSMKMWACLRVKRPGKISMHAICIGHFFLHYCIWFKFRYVKHTCSNRVPYSRKFWQEKTLTNSKLRKLHLAKRTSADCKVFPCQNFPLYSI